MRSAWRTVEKRCEIRIVVAVTRRREDALEDLGLAAHVELRRRLVEQDDAGAGRDRAQRAGERDALPLPAGEIGAAGVAAREDRVEAGERRGARGCPARRESSRPARRTGATLSRSGSSRRMKSWNTAVTRARHDATSMLAHVDAVDLDRARLRVVEAAQQLGERRLAGAVLPDDRDRRPGRDGQIEVLEHGLRRRDRRTSRRGSGSRAPAGRRRCGSRSPARRPAPSPPRAAGPRPPARRRRRAPS